MESNKIIKKTTSVIRRRLSPGYKLFLFGSFAQKKAHQTSDIDIAILGKEKVSRRTMSLILEEVDNISTLRKIEIVDLKTKNKVFKDAVLKYAKSL
ncbi:MAG: nucleotidyltransferase domain-containing protein [Candidatus Brennerbacteria bacterium]|nr:nucleotidyltransferase domain-containing protein [Candidatus Brennerbacteria bacterium]